MNPYPNIHDEELLNRHLRDPGRTKLLTDYIRERAKKREKLSEPLLDGEVCVAEAADLLEILMEEKRQA